jgi:AhpD family alkylhydroperoxidase
MSTSTEQTTDLGTAVESQAEAAFGFVPNLIREMTDHHPGVGATYLAANDAIEENGVLTPAEQQAVILAISSYNDCHYCTKAHAAAGRAAGLDPDAVAAINAGGLPDDKRLAGLVQATRRVMGKRGWLDADDLAGLEAKGVGRDAVYEIVAFVGIKTISNYVNHIADTPVDEAFADDAA